MYRPNLYSNGWIHSYLPADQNHASHAGKLAETLWLGLVEATGKAVGALANVLERRRVEAELYEMDDRELADIGLARSDIERVVSGRYIDERHSR